MSMANNHHRAIQILSRHQIQQAESAHILDHGTCELLGALTMAGSQDQANDNNDSQAKTYERDHAGSNQAPSRSSTPDCKLQTHLEGQWRLVR